MKVLYFAGHCGSNLKPPNSIRFFNYFRFSRFLFFPSSAILSLEDHGSIHILSLEDHGSIHILFFLMQ